MSLALLNQIGMILLLVALGYFLRKKNILTPDIQRTLSTIVVSVAIPCSIVASANMPMKTEHLRNAAWIAAISVIFHVLGCVFAFVYSRHAQNSAKANVLSALSFYSNAAFIGIPIIPVFLPDTGVFYLSFYLIGFNLMFFSWTQNIISGQRKFSLRSLATNISLYAIAIMLILFFAQIKLPAFLQNTLSSLGSLSTPLSLMVIGGMLAGFGLLQLFNSYALYFSAFIKLLVMPLCMFLLAKALALPLPVATVLLVISGLPSASLTAIVAAQNKNTPDEAQLAAKGVLLSTLLFVATMPLVALLQGML